MGSVRKKESLLWEQLNLHQIESYYLYIHVHPLNPSACRLKPYFQPYLFGHLEDWQQFTPSMLQWSSFSDPGQFNYCHPRRVDAINTIHRGRLDGWKRGDFLPAQDGSFRSSEAISDAHISGEERVRALFSHLSSWTISLELPAMQIERKNSNHFGTEHKIRLLRQIMNSTALLPSMSVWRSTD